MSKYIVANEPGFLLSEKGVTNKGKARINPVVFPYRNTYVHACIQICISISVCSHGLDVLVAISTPSAQTLVSIYLSPVQGIRAS